MCDLRGQPSEEQQQFTVAHQPANPPWSLKFPSHRHPELAGSASHSGSRLRGGAAAVARASTAAPVSEDEVMAADNDASDGGGGVGETRGERRTKGGGEGEA